MSFINLVVRKFIYFIKIENLLKTREIKKNACQNKNKWQQEVYQNLDSIKINGSTRAFKPNTVS